jgi:transposase
VERYIGLDAHGTSCTFVVIGQGGKKLRQDVIETNGAALISYLKSQPGRKHLCLEEGTQSAWMYEILSPHVDEMVVTNVSDSRGQKNDALDALHLAEQLRIGAIKCSVFKAPGQFSRLRELARVHSMLVGDVVRVQLRLKAIYRSRGVSTTGTAVYAPKGRTAWIQKLPTQHRWAVEKLHEEYDALLELKKAAESELIDESRKHKVARVLQTAPGLGPIRVAYLLPIVVTPHRFRTRRQFWSYCGLGIVMRSSSDWIRTENGGWARGQVQQTRGLNRKHNSKLKDIFKGAATTVITRLPKDPLHEHYQRLTAAGTKPNLAKVTIARRIAAIVLRMWKDGKEYDSKTLEATATEDLASPPN